MRPDPVLKGFRRLKWACSLVLPAVLLAAACQSTPKDLFVSKSIPPGSEVKTVVVLPMNFDHSPNASLQRGIRKLQREVKSQLSDANSHNTLTARFDLAKLLLRANRLPEARRHLNYIVKAYSRFPQAEEARRLLRQHGP